MSLTVEQMKYLAAKGLSLEEVIEFAEMAKPARNANAERQARYRERKRNVTRNVTDNALPPPDKEIPPKPPKEINPPISPTVSNETAPPLSVDEVLEGWNELANAHGLSPIRKLTEQRRRKVLAQAKRFSVPDWQAVFARISQSPFLKGENNRGWRCDFDFILSESNFVKILEGKYDRQPTDSRR